MKWVLPVFGALILFFIFPKFEYFPSQNAAYHAVMARNLALDVTQLPLLPTSLFKGHIVDQHLGLHYLISWVSPLFQNLWETLRFIQIAFLALFFVLAWAFLQREGVSKWISNSALGFALLFSGDLLNRVYFLRIESLVMASCMALLYFSDFIKKEGKAWIWYTLFFVSLSYSWINLVFIFIPVWLLFKQPRLLSYQLFGALLLILLSFQMRGDLFEIGYYFKSLVRFTFIENSGIHEWAPTSATRRWPYLLFFGLNLTLVIREQVMRLVSDRMQLMSLATLGFSLFSIFYSRFLTLAFFLNMILILYFIQNYLKSKKRAVLLEGVVFSISVISLLGYCNLRPHTFSRWNSEVHNYHNTIKSLNELTDLPKRVVITRWEHWSLLSWHLPQVVFEPGLSTLVYKESAPQTLGCFSKFRKTKMKWVFAQVQDCLGQIKAEFETDYLLIDTSYRHLAQFLYSYPILGQFIFYNSDGALFKISSDITQVRSPDDLRRIAFAYSKKYSSQEVLPPRFLVKSNGLIGTQSVASLLGLSPQRPISHEFAASTQITLSEPGFERASDFLRSAMSAWVFCRTEQVDKKTCHRWYSNYRQLNVFQDNLGVQAMLGLLAIELGLMPEIYYYQQKILAQISNRGIFTSITYGKRESIFYPGEALLFLYRSLSFFSSPSIRDKLEESYHFYWFQALSSGDPFYFRWLSEVIAARNSYFGLNQHYGAHSILTHAKEFWANYCPIFLGFDSDVTWSGLLLEGLVHLNKTQTTELLGSYYSCALGALKPIPELGKGYFALRESLPIIRDDIQAHSWGGLYFFEKGSPYD